VIAIIALVVVGLLLLLFAGGLVAARRRSRASEQTLLAKIAAADRALEAARAQDRGWDRVRLDDAARTALQRDRPDFAFDSLHLVLVEDRPGKDQDRAQMSAAGPDGEVRVVLVRHGDDWVAENVG
jgi:type II secretory pathway pseudopilin PulG